MAFTIIQDFNEVSPYPAFNDSYFLFRTIPDSTKATITVDGIATPFVIYPDSTGKFTFNFKEIAKSLFNPLDFAYTDHAGDDWSNSFSGNLVTVEAEITAGSDTSNKTWTFYKGAKQIGEDTDLGYILTHQSDPLTHNLTYWEGFPFDFQIKSITDGTEIKVKNLNNGLFTPVMEAGNTGSFRVYVDHGATNWTFNNVLPLMTLQNRLEVYEDDVFKANLILTKKEPCKGIYLRWFNAHSGINYHLFDQWHRITTGASTLNRIYSNSTAKLQNAVNPFKITGKGASLDYRLSTTVSKMEMEVLKGIMASPRVQLYTSSTPYELGKWVDVELTTRNLQIDTKRSNTEVTLEIALPDPVTLTL